MLCEKNSGIVRGQTLRVARRKYIAKSCSDVRKEKRFRGEINAFSPLFTASGLGLIHGKCRFLFEQP